MQEAVKLVQSLPGLQAVLVNCCAPQVGSHAFLYPRPCMLAGQGAHSSFLHHSYCCQELMQTGLHHNVMLLKAAYL